MEQPASIGIDLARNVFQLHGIDADGAVVLRRKLHRSQVLEVFARCDPCLVGMEACAGAHFRARELTALGHEVRMMPPSCVKPCVKRGKTDQADAAAICEGLSPLAQRSIDPMDRWKAQDDPADHAVRAGDVGGGEAPNATGP